jgi:hypothetical protein
MQTAAPGSRSGTINVAGQLFTVTKLVLTVIIRSLQAARHLLSGRW